MHAMSEENGSAKNRIETKHSTATSIAKDRAD
jgi:hypothetical protein